MEIRWYPPNTTPPKKKNRVIYRVLIKALGDDDDDLWFLNKALFLGGDIGEEGALRFPRNNTRKVAKMKLDLNGRSKLYLQSSVPWIF